MPADDDAGSDDPLVSVVVPTYDRPEYLVEAVESVLAQSYDPVELVVVDDHSPVPASTALGDLDTDALAAFRCLRHEENRGANAARNTGIEAATGEFVSFLDDDDGWDPTFLSQAVETFERADGDVGLVYAGARIVDDDGRAIRTSIPGVRGDVTEALARGEQIGSYSRVVVRADVIRRAGRPDERFPGWQDKEWYFRLSEHCAFETVEEPLVEHRIADHGQITDDFEGKRDVSYPLLLRKHRGRAARYGWLAERRLVATLAKSLSASALANGYHVDGLRYLLVSLVYYPLVLDTWLRLGLALGGPFTYDLAGRVRRRVAD
jgi:glycosyltransferase involved in cell wall biosynthesis